MKVAEFQRQAEREFQAQAEPSSSPAEPAEMPRILDPSDPLATARRFVAEKYTRGNRPILFRHNGDFFRWVRSHYTVVSETELRAQIYEFCESAKRQATGEKLDPFKPSQRRIGEILDALRSAVHLADEYAAPCWLEQVCDLEPRDLLPCGNGLVHLPENRLLGHDQDFFNTSALDAAFDPDAPEPTLWLPFLRQLWANDSESVSTLQEIMGYLLTPDTAQQKIFLLVGPKRSGKGTIARVITALLGKQNVASPTLASLSNNFGLAPLIGKPLAVIADARIGGRTDQATVVENLLNISGEDARTVDRKHQTPWTGTLPTRFLLLTNELPRLADASGALAGRLIVLVLTKSFYGTEDTGLTGKLLAERNSILSWTIQGRRRLHERGRFIQPAASADALREVEDLGSPVGAFVRERCLTEPGAEVSTDDLYSAWSAFCSAQGHKYVTARETFGRDLRAVVPMIGVRQRREGFKVVRLYTGIGLI